MASNKRAPAVVLSLALALFGAACSDGNSRADAGKDRGTTRRDGRADSANARDRSVVADRGAATVDRGAASADRGAVAADRGVGSPDAARDGAVGPPITVKALVDYVQLTGGNASFEVLAPQLNTALLGTASEHPILIELSGLNDATGQNDASVTVTLRQCPQALGLNWNQIFGVSTSVPCATGPVAATLTGSIQQGQLVAEGGGELMFSDGTASFALYVQNPKIEASLGPTGDQAGVHFLGGPASVGAVNGKLSGTISIARAAVGAYAFDDNAHCPNQNLLDTLVLGCAGSGITWPLVQPQIDVDGDGLETFLAECTTGTAGQLITCCRDGNSDQTQGRTCPQGATFKDAYRVQYKLHATRVSGVI